MFDAPNKPLKIAQWAGENLVPKAKDPNNIAKVKVVMSLDTYLVIDNKVRPTPGQKGEIRLGSRLIG